MDYSNVRFTEVMDESLADIPNKYIDMDEVDLVQQCKPTDKLTQMRFAFHVEIERSVIEGRRFRNENVFNGICSKVHFYKTILTTPVKLAYISRPLGDISSHLDVTYRQGIGRLNEIINMPFEGEDGVLDTKRIAIWWKVMNSLDDRLHGKAVERRINKELPANKPMEKTLPQGQNLELEAKELIKKIQGTIVEEITDGTEPKKK